MYELSFVDKQHKLNYEYYKSKFPISLTNIEYQSACYISSLPFLFEKYENEVMDFESPLDWIFNWQMNNADVTYDLTTSMQELGKLAMNLFNNYEEFNLMDCLNSLDEQNVEVLKVAIDVRLGIYKGQ